MELFDLYRRISVKNDKKILLIVLDGIGDLPVNGVTPLEAARTPNLDKLASESTLGLHFPVGRGITPGSGPGHLSLFGYDPLKYEVGRGVLSALGLGMELTERDVAARGNFATIDSDGKVIDRRAGRIPTDLNRKLIEKLSKEIKEIDGVEVFLKTEAEHRFALVLRGEDLGGRVSDTDPQLTGKPPLEPVGEDEKSQRTAEVVKKFIEKAAKILADEHPANFLLLRGFDKLPPVPSFEEIFKLKAGAIASYPMYRGVAKLVGMEILGIDGEGELLKEKIELLKKKWNEYEFIFLHIKKTDSYGEDGNFDAKVHHIESFDEVLPEILALSPDVLAITGDHSTPVPLKNHSWHPVPVLIHSPYVRKDDAKRFTEKEALKGSLGMFRGTELMPQLMAHALKFKKFGA